MDESPSVATAVSSSADDMEEEVGMRRSSVAALHRDVVFSVDDADENGREEGTWSFLAHLDDAISDAAVSAFTLDRLERHVDIAQRVSDFVDRDDEDVESSTTQTDFDDGADDSAWLSDDDFDDDASCNRRNGEHDDEYAAMMSFTAAAAEQEEKLRCSKRHQRTNNHATRRDDDAVRRWKHLKWIRKNFIARGEPQPPTAPICARTDVAVDGDDCDDVAGTDDTAALPLEPHSGAFAEAYNHLLPRRHPVGPKRDRLWERNHRCCDVKNRTHIEEPISIRSPSHRARRGGGNKAPRAQPHHEHRRRGTSITVEPPTAIHHATRFVRVVAKPSYRCYDCVTRTKPLSPLERWLTGFTASLAAPSATSAHRRVATVGAAHRAPVREGCEAHWVCETEPGGVWMPYDADVETVLEQEYQRGALSVQIDVDGCPLVVDLVRMAQTRRATSTSAARGDRPQRVHRFVRRNIEAERSYVAALSIEQLRTYISQLPDLTEAHYEILYRLHEEDQVKPRGASADELSTLEHLTFEALMHRIVTGVDFPGFSSECLICLEDFAGSDALALLPVCSHFFHSACAADFFRRYSGRCPVCRQAVGGTTS